MDFLKGKTMALIEGQYEVLPSGATYGAASAVSAKYTGFGPFKDLTGRVFSSPLEARVPKEGTNTRHLHSRFALMEKDITFAMTTFSSFMLEILRYIENNWEILVHDIETGTIVKALIFQKNQRKHCCQSVSQCQSEQRNCEQYLHKDLRSHLFRRFGPVYA